MDFRIADTFTDSLARLTSDEQKAVKTTAFDLQMSPAQPGMQFHRLDRARDRNFWSVRVSSDLRLIVHRTDASLLLCYVDHHDKAYAWAERRKLETHPKTGAAQLVEIRETVKEIVVPVYVPAAQVAERPAAPSQLRLFASLPDDELLGYGVPGEWLRDVKSATADGLLALADHLPAEAAEALLELATGGKPRAASAPSPAVAPFDHPDAQRRFRVMSNVEELRRALDEPWEKWCVFLHPEQRGLVERTFAGPARVAGSAGTGKTIVAVHRAVHLARVLPEARVLLTTFSDPLAAALAARVRRLLGSSPGLGERIDVHSLDAVGLRLHRAHVGPVSLVRRDEVVRLVREAAAAVPGHKFTQRFLLGEWDHVVDAWQLGTWEAYRDVARLGRRTRLSEAQRRVLWTVFERVHGGLRASGQVTTAGMFTAVAGALRKGGRVVYDAVVVDEAQDVSVAQLGFLAALAGSRPNALFLVPITVSTMTYF